MIAAPHNLQLQLPLGQIADFCHRWGIARLEIFGSVLGDVNSKAGHWMKCPTENHSHLRLKQPDPHLC
jgi:hypothetical protein